ncbi:MAG: hypothetical protein MAG715_01039 [Methanonatronarchaeales archaeon]|nr:hypothetical protein [Methanonatronarchaeales archaeon]
MNWIIRHEEQYLEERSGDEYREYRSHVRRWVQGAAAQVID